MKTISVLYEKGGVGKTTTAVNLSAKLADLEYRVLLVDADPQSYATGYYDLYDDTPPSLYDVMSKGTPAADAIRHTAIERLDILPAVYRLEAIETELAAIPFGQEFVLRDALESVRDAYDFAIIDCPPSGVRIKTNAMATSDGLILTTIPDDYAVQGLRLMSQRLRAIQRATNPALRVLGVLVTLDERTCNKMMYKDALRQLGLFPVFRQTIRKNTTISEAVNAHQPIHRYAPHSIGAQDYNTFAHEFLEVIDHAEAETER